MIFLHVQRQAEQEAAQSLDRLTLQTLQVRLHWDPEQLLDFKSLDEKINTLKMMHFKVEKYLMIEDEPELCRPSAAALSSGWRRTPRLHRAACLLQKQSEVMRQTTSVFSVFVSLCFRTSDTVLVQSVQEGLM